MKKMKKLFTLALALLCGMGAMADDYTGHLVLVRGGETIQDQEKVATLTRLDNGQYTLSVDNLTYEAAGMGIGNVVIDSIDAVGNPDQPGVTDLGVAKSIRARSRAFPSGWVRVLVPCLSSWRARWLVSSISR